MPIGGDQPPGVASGPQQLPANLDPRSFGPSVGGADLAAVVEVVDYQSTPKQSAPAGSDGVTEVVYQTVPNGHLWMVERVVVKTDEDPDVADTEAFLYVGPVDDANLADQTRAGYFDVADNFQPLMVPAGVALRVRWENAAEGTRGVARVQYRLARLNRGG